MLRELRIRDIAIVDDLALTFGPGLNVLTGETGAGKSIILQSLALLCGSRGGADLIRNGADEALVEGLFEIALPAEQRDALGLGDEDELLVRRHLSRSGKGRLYVNGGPATLGMLAQIGNSLIHIYGQHDHALLLRPGSHLDLLDQFGDLGARAARMAAAAGAWAAARQRLAEIEQHRAGLADRRDLLEYQLGELTAAAVQSGEESGLRQERELLRHAERVRQVCHEGDGALYSGHGAMVASLGRLAGQLAELAAIAPALAGTGELVESGRVQLEEAALQLRAMAERAHSDPERLDAVEERLALLSRLTRKYGVASDNLAEICAAVGRDLATLDANAGDVIAARAELDVQRRAALTVARELSAARAAAARSLETRMGDELAVLGMGGATFRVEHHVPTDDDADAALGPGGIDRVEYFLAANPGEAPQPLARVASGGELSRIMLALKALTASAGETPILIFDEVDAGIGGTVADAVAKRLKSLARARQLLCITHLPQIAAYADQHFAVDKHQARGRTITRARALAADERVAEVSRMLGGATAPAEAERYARRLIAEARRAS